MFKIQKGQAEQNEVQFTLSGHLQFGCVSELRELIRKEARKVVLDLREVKLVDRGVIEFLAGCERDGIALRNCPPYIREWIIREIARRQSFQIDEES
jgi:hypothetical protein